MIVICDAYYIMHTDGACTLCTAVFCLFFYTNIYYEITARNTTTVTITVVVIIITTTHVLRLTRGVQVRLIFSSPAVGACACTAMTCSKNVLFRIYPLRFLRREIKYENGPPPVLYALRENNLLVKRCC